MTLQNDLQFKNTQAKLQELEELIKQAKSSDAPGRDTAVRSLSRLANQLREEIIRYKSTTTVKSA